MRGIELKNGCLLYYGSPAGYQGKEGMVADPMFRRQDLEEWLARHDLPVRWVDGVYDRLSSGAGQRELAGETPLKRCRIWQLRPDTPIEMRFIGLDRMTEKYGGPDAELYHVAYDGEVESNDLEAIWDKFCRKHLEGAEHPLAISDVIELYDGAGSDFYYVDKKLIVPVDFGGQEPSAGMTMTL